MKSEELSKCIYDWAYVAARQTLPVHSAEAEDVAQETWLAIDRLGEQFPQDRSHLKRLVCRIAVNKSKDFYRKIKGGSLDVETAAFDSKKKAVAQKVKRLAKQVWDCLETPERDLVAMRADEGLSFGQIADRTNRSRSSISSVFQRLPNKIEKRLRQRGMK
tara:strand:- start:37 stop:519 length:483 start_codon:yes stop_codon:yes gene_type:complete